MKSRIIFGLILVLTLGAPGILTAQILSYMKDEPLGFIESPTNFATRGLYTTAVDDYISAAYFRDAEFDKWFAFGSFDQTTRGSLGSALYFGDIYFGFYYGGNFLRGFADNTYRETEIPWVSGNKTFKDYYGGLLYDAGAAGWIPHVYGSANDNRIAVLIGLGDMGFRLSFASNYNSFHGKDILDSTSTLSPTAGESYKTFDTAYGWMIPELQWGMTRPLTAKGIQPTVTFDIGFYRDYMRFEAYTGIDTTDGEYIDYASNFMRPQISLGLGGYTLSNGNHFSTAFDLDYSFGMYLFNNDYSYWDGTEFKTKTIKGTVNNMYGEWLERSYQSHSFTPSISTASTGMDRLRLSARLSVPVNFDTAKITYYDDPDLHNGDLEKDIAITETIFTVRPILDLGMQYEAIPGKLTINAGGRIETAQLELSSFNIEVVGSDPFKAHTTEFNAATYIVPAGTGLYAGLSFDFSDHFGLDALMAVNTVANRQNGVNAINLFGTTAGATGSLTAFFQILATVRF